MLGAVFIVFLVLKLTGVIDWSWWWVTAPLWVGCVPLIVVSLLLPRAWRPPKRRRHTTTWPSMGMGGASGNTTNATSRT